MLWVSLVVAIWFRWLTGRFRYGCVVEEAVFAALLAETFDGL